jgi:hypothetical protein
LLERTLVDATDLRSGEAELEPAIRTALARRFEPPVEGLVDEFLELAGTDLGRISSTPRLITSWACLGSSA